VLAREPYLFLNSLAAAFSDNTTPQTMPRRNAHFFYGAKFAAMSRLMALDRIIPKFESFSNWPHNLERRFEEDQLLYEFFSNAYSLIDSFCFGAYFIGSQLSPPHFDPNPSLRSINPWKTLRCFEEFDMNSAFTKALKATLASSEYDKIGIRNVLLHRITPGRTVSLTTGPIPTPPNSWNRDMWEEGDWRNEGPGVGRPPPKKEFLLESKSLVEMRDWSDQQLDLLGKELESLAAHHGLR
jgi:hypothetical protein